MPVKAADRRAGGLPHSHQPWGLSSLRRTNNLVETKAFALQVGPGVSSEAPATGRIGALLGVVDV